MFSGGATTSQHVDAEDDDHFHNTSFKLKRTRSLGLLDEFIDPQEQEKKAEQAQHGRSALEPEAGLPKPDEPASGKTPTPLSVTSPELIPHDDTDLTAEPSRHVDYLSHQWDVADILKSWRYVISRRKDVANAARLENASWRTWAQRRSNLKTISPEEVNWLKDSDVTWLYGPILIDEHDDDTNHDDRRGSTATSAVAGDISIARKKPGPKPILKKRTVEDMIISHLNLRKLEIATARTELEQKRREEAEQQQRREAAANLAERPPEYFDYNAISAKLNSQYKNFSQPNSRAVLSTNLRSDEAEQPQPQQPQQPEVPKLERHIHFNDEVQQCIAVNEQPPLDYDDYYDEYDDDDYYNDDDSYLYESYNDKESLEQAKEENDEESDEESDDEGGFFLRVRLPNLAGLQLPGLRSSKDSIDSDSSAKSYKTIQLLPSTTLNYGSSDEESDYDNPYTSSLSHNVGSDNRGYDYYYDYNTVYQVDPNHAIYGTNRSKAPDVVDVPENISMGSNFDYDIIENEDIQNFEHAPLGVINRNDEEGDRGVAATEKEKFPLSLLEDSKPRNNPFALDSDSDSDSDNENDGLLISARNSSQSLAHLVFSGPMSQLEEPQPQDAHISSINPRYQLSGLAKQPHSLSLLAQQFSGEEEHKPESQRRLLSLFFDQKEPLPDHRSLLGGTVLPPVQPKASPLPPQTTLANAFLGKASPPVEGKKNSAFVFDSDSDSEEFVEDAESQHDSYASLSQVADKNGLRVSPDADDPQRKKGVAGFLGNWKHQP